MENIPQESNYGYLCVKKGILVTNLKKKWRNFLFIIQKFITCEGRFSNMFFYHARLMRNFLEGKEINLPHFLIHNLRKMFGSIQIKMQSIDNALYHHGLVKILIESYLKNIGDNWENFLIRSHFKEAKQGETSKTRKNRRKFPLIPKDNSPPQ